MTSSLSSVGLVAALARGEQRVALISGVIAFVSSTFTLLAQYWEDFAGGQKSLRELRDKVASQLKEGLDIDAEYKLMTARGDFSAIEPLIRRLNVALASMRQIEFATE